MQSALRKQYQQPNRKMAKKYEIRTAFAYIHVYNYTSFQFQNDCISGRNDRHKNKSDKNIKIHYTFKKHK